MTSLTGNVKPRAFTVELDVLRGLAAVLMIFNHSGFRLLSPDDVFHSASAVAVFLGSMAPVLFFFATGFGIALSTQNRSRPLDKLGLLWKAFLLVLADQFFLWSRGVAWGIDFFSFIAISTVVVSIVSKLKGSKWICAALVVTLLLTRYVVGESLQPLIRNYEYIVWLLGVKAIEGISYPLSPWLVYPLLGYILGSFYGPVNPQVSQPRNRWIRIGILGAILFLAASFVMRYEKAVFFRWDSMTLGFFVLSISALCASAVLALVIVMRSERLSAWISLRGVTSFTVIPLHYVMLEGLVKFLPLPQPEWVVVLLTLAVLVASFIASNWFAAVASSRWVAAHQQKVFVFALGIVIVCVTLALISFNYETVPTEMSRLFGQLSIAVLLGFGIPKRSSAVPRFE
jgi:uncharacterized membrane protein